ncbi:hypothetical protein [Streptomyces niveus]|uniref:hypothetical protein n=1 Tax=Streptomyces niveus TaxID=193462 RepID=UPI0003C5C4E0|nr:hypothetical protein [Streptomyces niveus]EST29322.1 hypothetical protein M877_12285 [Streptomyces niveus NCIMB 11891]
MAPQDSQPNQDPVEAAWQQLAATYKAIAAEQGLTGQLGDSPNPNHWRTIMNTSATTQQAPTQSADGQQQSRTSALTFLPPTTPTAYAPSSATRPAGQPSGQPKGNTPGQSR